MESRAPAMTVGAGPNQAVSEPEPSSPDTNTLLSSTSLIPFAKGKALTKQN